MDGEIHVPHYINSQLYVHYDISKWRGFTFLIVRFSGVAYAWLPSAMYSSCYSKIISSIFLFQAGSLQMQQS